MTTECGHCRDAKPLDFEFTFAFQPIVDWRQQVAIGYEALVRGQDGSGAASVLSRLDASNIYTFDQLARQRAIRLGSRLLPPDAYLFINILPNAIYDPVRCFVTTLKTAKELNFPLARLVMELSETEKVDDIDHVKRIFAHYSGMGLKTAIDDFGSGFSDLRLLLEFTPQVIKLDRSMVTDVDACPKRQAIVLGVVAICQRLEIQLVAEGVETANELACLLEVGVTVFQGYFFAKPAFEAAPAVDFAALSAELDAARLAS